MRIKLFKNIDTVDKRHSQLSSPGICKQESSLLKLSLLSLSLGVLCSFGKDSYFSRGCCHWHFPWILPGCLAGLSVLLHCLKTCLSFAGGLVLCACKFNASFKTARLPPSLPLSSSSHPPPSSRGGVLDDFHSPSPPLLSCDSRSLCCRLNWVNYRQNLEGPVSMGVGMWARLKTPRT